MRHRHTLVSVVLIGHSGRVPESADPSDRSEVNELILGVLSDIEPLMRAAFDAVGGQPAPGSGLDQVYLLDGRTVVVDYLAHGEPQIAFDHLLYMIEAPPLAITGDALGRLAQAGTALGVPPKKWESIRTQG
jgi:hypothetical protein